MDEDLILRAIAEESRPKNQDSPTFIRLRERVMSVAGPTVWNSLRQCTFAVPQPIHTARHDSTLYSPRMAETTENT